MIVYVATNRKNGHKYVGKTVKTIERRRAQHERAAKSRRTSAPFHKALRSYDYDFDWSVVKKCASIKEMNAEEIRAIAFFKPEYNLTPGGDGGDTRSNNPNRSTIAKACSKAMKKKWREPGYRERMSEMQSGENNGFYGKKHSDESKEKMRRSKIGHKIGADNSKAKKWIFTDPSGKKHIVIGEFGKFCDEHGLKRSTMRKVFDGEIKQGHSKGWSVARG